ncbi:hypothetical protein PIB30_037568 [Stylosanthes scabra]|uniref:Uncharacterized protein n=1 Tax=Stylosanthes scabra TaxID=79078 RepID=A0ABU6UD19_9FABA|nr:hypothetical protein [Stylosanthes scabra]
MLLPLYANWFGFMVLYCYTQWMIGLRQTDTGGDAVVPLICRMEAGGVIMCLNVLGGKKISHRIMWVCLMGHVWCGAATSINWVFLTLCLQLENPGLVSGFMRLCYLPMESSSSSTVLSLPLLSNGASFVLNALHLRLMPRSLWERPLPTLSRRRKGAYC